MTGKKKNPLVENPRPYHDSVTANHCVRPRCLRWISATVKFSYDGILQQ